MRQIELVDLQKTKLEKDKWISSKIYSELKNCIDKKSKPYFS